MRVVQHRRHLPSTLFFLPSLPDRSPTPARRQKCPIVFRFDSHPAVYPISALRLDNTFPHSTFTSHPLPFHVLFPAHQRSGFLACPELALSIHQGLKKRDNNGLQQTLNRHCPQHYCKCELVSPCRRLTVPHSTS